MEQMYTILYSDHPNGDAVLSTTVSVPTSSSSAVAVAVVSGDTSSIPPNHSSIGLPKDQTDTTVASCLAATAAAFKSSRHQVSIDFSSFKTGLLNRSSTTVTKAVASPGVRIKCELFGCSCQCFTAAGHDEQLCQTCSHGWAVHLPMTN